MIKAASKKSGRSTRSAAGRRRGILCGTDFSEGARHAARVAGAIAKRIHEPLILTHAVDMPRLGARHTKTLKWLTAIRRKELRQEAEDIRRTGATVEERTPPGRPDEVLLNLARTKTPRLLVVSSIGLRGLQRWLVGSVSERTAERATIPTLVVRDSRPLIAWARGERPLKVFACFNCTATSETALRWINDLQAIGPCEVVIGFVDWPPEQWSRLGGGSLPFDGNPPETQAVLERDVKARASELLGPIPFRLRIEANWGRPDARLADLAKEEGADLVVVGSHQYRNFERLWHTSVSRGLLHLAATNVAVVPLATDKRRGPGIAPAIRSVLVTSDFSELANAAIPRAYSILRGGGKVHLLHVIPQPFEVPGGRPGGKSPARRPNTPEARRLQACASRLRALIPPEAAAQGISTQIEVSMSRDVAKAICQNAERLGADVICLATHGRSGLSRAFAGSVAQGVMARSHRPLLVVRPQPK